jgi:tetratricopeptide (TPR) repeat protein
MDLDDLGLGATVVSPYNPSWPDEKAPEDRAFKVICSAFDWLNAGEADLALSDLLSIRDSDLDESPSFAMRRYYYIAMSYFKIAEHAKMDKVNAAIRCARDNFKLALSLAVSRRGAFSDTLSQITLYRMLGEAWHNLVNYEQALSEYLTSLTTLRRFPASDKLTSARAEIKLRMLVARQQYILGQYAAALDNITTLRELRGKFGGPATTQWDRAAEEWIEAMIQRGASHQCGGDITMLRGALRLFKSAERRLVGDEEHRLSQRRLYIQIADTHLDLAERYRSLENIPSYTTNMRQAEKYAIMASDALRETDDDAGKALTTLTLLRHDYLSVKAYELASRIHEVKMGGKPATFEEHALAPRIYDLEKQAVAVNDLVLIARAATLRADVLFSMHDYAAAMTVYYFALATFERAGARGEATRAVYGVRRALEIV